MNIFLAASTATETVTAVAETMTSVPLFKVDLTVTISVILAGAAIVSPILTTLLSNLHDTKIKKMELQQKHFEQNTLHSREVFEKYLKYAMICMEGFDMENIDSYYEYYILALIYASKELRTQMKEIHTLIMARYQPDYEITKLDDLTPHINELLEKWKTECK